MKLRGFRIELGEMEAALSQRAGVRQAATRSDGWLPGRLDANWHGTVSWACLTGSVQIALCWLLLYQDIGELR